MREIYLISLVLVLIACGGDVKEKAEESVDQKDLLQYPLESDTGTLPIPDDTILLNLVNENLTGLNNEDVGWAVQPLHTNSPYMDDPVYHVQGSFLVYDMKFELIKFEIISKSEKECIAIIEHDSHNFSDREYSPQRSKQRYTYRPDGKNWKIYKMEVLGSSPI